MEYCRVMQSAWEKLSKEITSSIREALGNFNKNLPVCESLPWQGLYQPPAVISNMGMTCSESGYWSYTLTVRQLSFHSCYSDYSYVDQE
jgi:hypothetical protein